MKFSDLRLHPDVLRAIDDAGYTHPTPIQRSAIPRVLAGKDVLGIAQTGTGKTAAFTLPMIHRLLKETPRAEGTRALIIAPTRELAMQIDENVRKYSAHTDLSIGAVVGGVGESPQIEALDKGADIIIATPGRLSDLIADGHGKFGALEFLVLDEVDRMLDMGFLPQVKEVTRGFPRKRQTLLFSATLAKPVREITGHFLKEPSIIEIGKQATPADTVDQSVVNVEPHLKQALLEHLLEDHNFYTVLVFASMKQDAEDLGKRLAKSGVSVAVLHGDRSQNQRSRALDDFRSGKIRVLVATDVAARGIDVDGVTHVINYDFPRKNDDYVHRIGRTGRAGENGRAITFVTHRDRDGLRRLERFIERTLPRDEVAGFDFDQFPPEHHLGPRRSKPKRSADPRDVKRAEEKEKAKNRRKPVKRKAPAKKVARKSAPKKRRR
ncbi:DEAD/DEAH box helicase [Sulfuriroseicoccus oceanibius]|uniref:DEAD/DEAH box helicase n=1 Tax=Sulfuriroseicoccus oceanibius TaxID=2707525 RepID=A0A6B3LFJ9_9BACT|nr:DEAD/DEAH box helicase [Sulfuriroseicoccus oceanibius]QQL45366.1 DEAD/DEAH box helicase [Sulfuriroseicoccus oceanibius]